MLVPHISLYPPVNGGMQRSFHIFHQLCRHFEVTVITRQSGKELEDAVKAYPALGGATIISMLDAKRKKDIFSIFPLRLQNALRYRWYKKSINESADLLFLDYYHVLKSTLSSNIFHYVMLENLSTLNAVSVIRELSPATKIIYDAHNVESNLAFQSSNSYYTLIEKAESSFSRNIDALITCSKKDEADFQHLNNHQLKTAVIPNGVEATVSVGEAVNKDQPEFILFCGSLDYSPNSEGLLWFYTTCWNIIKSQIPGIRLLVVGSGKRSHVLNVMDEDTAVIFTGRVDDVKEFYNKASVVIVPIKSGSGTRLKVLEAMGLGVPVVSTCKGAEGINHTDEIDIVIADKADDFTIAVIALLQNKPRRIRMQQQAHKLVSEQYDWNIIGDSLAFFLNNLG